MDYRSRWITQWVSVDGAGSRKGRDKMIITDIQRIEYRPFLHFSIPNEYLMEDEGYTVLDNLLSVGMKPLGRIYFDRHENLNYTDGTPVEKPIISGGEKGVLQEYLKAGERVYTEKQVINIINSRCYESNDDLKPKIPPEIAQFLKGVSKNTAKNKPKRAKELLEKYSVIGEEDVNE